MISNLTEDELMTEIISFYDVAPEIAANVIKDVKVARFVKIGTMRIIRDAGESYTIIIPQQDMR
jgi:hypothetical protein